MRRPWRPLLILSFWRSTAVYHCYVVQGSPLETMGPVHYKGCSRIDVNSNVHHPKVYCPIIHHLIQSTLSNSKSLGGGKMFELQSTLSNSNFLRIVKMFELQSNLSNSNSEDCKNASITKSSNHRDSNYRGFC